MNSLLVSFYEPCFQQSSVFCD